MCLATEQENVFLLEMFALHMRHAFHVTMARTIRKFESSYIACEHLEKPWRELLSMDKDFQMLQQGAMRHDKAQCCWMPYYGKHLSQRKNPMYLFIVFQSVRRNECAAVQLHMHTTNA